MKIFYKKLVAFTSKPTGKRLLGRPRHRGEDNMTIDIKGIYASMRNWFDLTQDKWWVLRPYIF